MEGRQWGCLASGIRLERLSAARATFLNLLRNRIGAPASGTARHSSRCPVTISRSDISVEPISRRMTLNLPAMTGAALRTLSFVRSSSRSAFSATAEIVEAHLLWTDSRRDPRLIGNRRGVREDVHEVAQFLPDLGRIVHRLGDLDLDHFAEPLPQSMDRHLHRALAKVEFAGGLGLGKRGHFSQQPGLEHGELPVLTLRFRLRTQIESGRLTARLEFANGGTLRFRTMGAGTVVGEVGLFLGGVRTASVVSDQPSTVYRLTVAALERMNRDNPDLALTFHRYLICQLGERLTSNSKLLRGILE